MEIEIQEDFLSFEADLVAEQLTYMDAVSTGKRDGNRTERLQWLHPDRIFHQWCHSHIYCFVFFCLALQLLFKKVVPHHCLGSIWSQRDKKHNKHCAPTIRATITQFNAVAACVVSTVLKHRQIRPHVRARVIQRWIDIAQVSKTLKLS